MLRHIDGFDHYGANTALLLNGPYAQASSVTLDATAARTGTRGLKLTAGTGILRRVLGADLSEVGIGFAFKVNSLPSGSTDLTLCQLRDNGNYQIVTLTLSSTGQIIATRGGNTGALLGTSSPVVYTGSYQHLETLFVCDASGGAIEVRLNGVTVLNITGADTLTHETTVGVFSTALPAQYAMGGTRVAILNSADMWIDDLMCWDTLSGDEIVDFVGDKKVYTRFPDADTATNDWVPSSGSESFEMLNNNPPIDTDYLSAEAMGDTVIVGIEDLPPEVISIAAIMTASRLWKSDAGVGSVIASIISGASESDGADNALSLAPTYYHDVHATDPATGAPWTLSGFNAAQYQLYRSA